MRCFTNEDGDDECYSEREVREAEASGWFLAAAALFMLWVAGVALQVGTRDQWAVLTSKPIGWWEIVDFLRASEGDILFAVVLFVFGMGMAIQIFGAFRGPGSTPGPVMRDMSGGDYDPPWGDSWGGRGGGNTPM